MSFYNNVYKIFAKPFRLMFGLHIHGEENLPEEGGWLVCANHTSALDVIIVSLATRRQVMYMANAELFRVPVVRKLLSSLGAYPVHRGGADVTSIKKAISYLEEGDLVGIFPQGTRRPKVDPRTTPVKHGVGLISYRAKRGVIPMYIKTKNNHVRFFKRTDLYIGAPIEYGELGFTDGGMKEYNAAAELVFDRICTIGETADK